MLPLRYADNFGRGPGSGSKAAGGRIGGASYSVARLASTGVRFVLTMRALGGL